MVVHMVRNQDGSLTVQNQTSTSGAGTNGLGPGGTAVAADDLVSQHSVIISSDNKTLFAINAADNSISTFSIDPATGNLTLEKKTTTNGSFPNSLAYSSGTLFVSFVNGADQLAAFEVNSDGSLTPNGSYTLPLAPGSTTSVVPTQVTVSPDGTFLLVGSKTGEVISFPINGNGTLGNAVVNPTNIAAPFAGAFLSNGIYLSTDAATAALESFGLSQGSLTAIGGPVLATGQKASCWLSVTPSGTFAYVGNGGGTISSFSVNSTGALTLLNATAANEGIAVAGDSWISKDGKFLYTAYLAKGMVIAYAINSDGSLSKVGTPASIVTNGSGTMQGLAGI